MKVVRQYTENPKNTLYSTVQSIKYDNSMKIATKKPTNLLYSTVKSIKYDNSMTIDVRHG